MRRVYRGRGVPGNKGSGRTWLSRSVLQTGPCPCRLLPGKTAAREERLRDVICENKFAKEQICSNCYLETGRASVVTVAEEEDQDERVEVESGHHE